MVQTAVNSGLMRGLTADSSGAVIANATITLTSRALVTAVTRNSNSAGMFVFPAQPVGRYSMEVKADGFRTQVVNAVDVERKTLCDQCKQMRINRCKQVGYSKQASMSN
jgi:hypothetical protein